MDEKTLSLFEDVPIKPDHRAPRKDVPKIGDTCISFDELKDKKIVVTGELFQMKREEFRLWLQQRGAKFLSSVSSYADLLVVGENPGGVKVTRAKELDISVCYESEFFEKFGRQLSIKV